MTTEPSSPAASASPADVNTRAAWLGFALVLLVAAAFRLFDLGGTPPGLFRDELEKGYTALELWHTGRQTAITADGTVTSRLFPVFAAVFTDRTTIIYQYLSAPFVGLFGLGPVTTRLVAALAGVASVGLVWLLARRWYGGTAVPLVAALALALSPTAIVFSRWAQQGCLTIPLVLGGVLAFWAAFHPRGEGRHHTRALAALAGILFGLAFYAYDPVRPTVLVVALALVATVGTSRLQSERDPLFVFAALFLLVAVPTVLAATTAEGASRFRRVGVFSEGIAPGLAVAAGNYLAHFDPRFLFLFGDANPRHGPEFGGLVGPEAVVPILAGIVAALGLLSTPGDAEARTRRALLLAWLLAAPVGASLTREGIPHALRSILLLPVLALLAGEGAQALRAAIIARRRVITGLYAGAVLASLCLAAANHNAMGMRHLGAWATGAIPALERAAASRPPGGYGISTGVLYAPYYLLFHEGLDPVRFQAEGLDALGGRLVPYQLPPSRLPEGFLLVAPDPYFIPAPGAEPVMVLLEVRGGRWTLADLDGASTPGGITPPPG